jgi:hypothetical protein
MARLLGSLFVALMPLPQRSTLLGLVVPLSPPSHSLHPMEQPTDIHRQVWAEAHGLLPFRHAHGAPAFPMCSTHMYGEFPS